MSDQKIADELGVSRSGALSDTSFACRERGAGHSAAGAKDAPAREQRKEIS